MRELDQTEIARRAEAHRKRSSRILLLVAFLVVLIPFLFWRGTWFGRTLTDEEISEYLSDATHPRHPQHALVQVGERLNRGDTSVRRWYPQVVSLASSPYPEIRVTLAWVMGGDNHSDEFHQALLGLLKDSESLVRRNAALSLVRFGDASGRPELLSMLRSYTVTAPRDGVIHYRVQQGAAVEHGTVLAESSIVGGAPLEVKSPLPGKLQNELVKEGVQVTAGENIAILSPAADHVWEALRALYLVGQPQDLADVQPFASGEVPAMPSKVRQQATLTAAEIRRRSSQAVAR